MNNLSESKYHIPVLQKVLEIQELMTSYPQGLTLQEIVNELNIAKTTAFRILNFMMEAGYLCKNIETQRFYLSKKYLSIGLAALGERNIVEQALPAMRALRDEIRETVMLGAFVDNRVVLLEQVLGSHNFTFLLRPGSTFELLSSAPGKVFLAYLQGNEQEEALRSIEYRVFTERTIRDEAQMRTEIARILESGYAVDVEEEMRGVHCVGAPIFNQFGSVVAALWTSGPSGRLTEEQIPEIASRLLSTARRISMNLGYTAI